MNRLRILAPLAIAAVLTGCEADPPLAPAVSGAVWNDAAAPSAAPRFVHRAPTAPPFKNEVAVLRVRPGVAATGDLTFADGSPFATLLLPAGALVGAHVNGKPVPQDQEITITLRRVDSSRFYVQLEPAGLVFNTQKDQQPVIIFDYTHARIPEGVGALEIWKQHQVGDAWLKTETHDHRATRTTRGRVEDFTHFTLSFP